MCGTVTGATFDAIAFYWSCATGIRQAFLQKRSAGPNQADLALTALLGATIAVDRFAALGRVQGPGAVQTRRSAAPNTRAVFVVTALAYARTGAELSGRFARASFVRSRISISRGSSHTGRATRCRAAIARGPAAAAPPSCRRAARCRCGHAGGGRSRLGHRAAGSCLAVTGAIPLGRAATRHRAQAQDQSNELHVNITQTHRARRRSRESRPGASRRAQPRP